MKIEKSLIAIVASLAMIVACDDNTGNLGSSITPDIDIIEVDTSTYYASSRSISIDSVLAKTSQLYLGRFTDPETNAVFEADFMTQFNCIEGERVFPIPDSIQGDTAARTELRMYFTKFFGDSTNTMKAEVYELDQPLLENKSYYTNTHPEEFYDESKGPIATKYYTAMDYTLDDGVLNDRNHYDNVAITLPNEIGNRIIKQYRTHPEYFENATNFNNEVCKGYYVKCTKGDGTVLYLDQVSLNVYFHYIPKDSAYVTQFTATQEVVQVNHFVNRNLEPLINRTDVSYLKTPSGIITEVTLPIDEITATNDSINSAKISFSRYNSDLNNRYAFGTPQTLLMVRKGMMKDFFEKNMLTDDKSSFYTVLDARYNRYDYNNIARLIWTCENERRSYMAENNIDEAAYEAKFPDWNKVVLVPVTTIIGGQGNIINFRHDLRLNSTRLVGGDNDKIAIKIITSKF